MVVRLAINGFGRIGRVFFRRWLKERRNIEVVAINDLTDPQTLFHLLRYDSVHGRLDFPVSLKGDTFSTSSGEVRILQIPDPQKLPWKELGVDLVLESTGKFTKRKDAEVHLQRGARKVLISAPADGADITVCYGINHRFYDPKTHTILSNASCTTNCLAPLVYVLHKEFGIESGFMTTVHSYTNDQRVLDLPHKDLRRARAAGINIIPTSTGAARAIGLVIPELKGKLNGVAIRVPTPNVSLTDFTALLKKEVTVEEVNSAMERYARGELKGILRYETDPLVSSDFNGDPHSAILDSRETDVLEKKLVKVLAWYDNETGFSARLLDFISYMGEVGI
jgi:glyceraldehyde 3-phosphate dehydrogenase